MDEPQADIETQVVDIRDVPLGELSKRDRTQFEPYLEELLRQVTRPRYNLSTGPPGRVD
ncbi:hypothetical protein [Actinoplanes sp. L3-i22]|uniref:hypothetical protein n=1 Tax=Actinoplanes sp. L3-i22 TaxID=2836373 RepID=UPI001C7736DB|nr:hypothetical protein [Actinoplanes sp. L3-i22]BCY08906.1 hypothetical protein L3i22_039940 [Actinoplanes sp. L3-i22]